MNSTVHENRPSPFRTLLFDISEELTRQDVEKIKYLCSDSIPRGPAEDIQNGLQLFDALERNALISPQNLDLLAVMLLKIGRKDLSSKVDKFRRGLGNHDPATEDSAEGIVKEAARAGCMSRGQLCLKLDNGIRWCRQHCLRLAAKYKQITPGQGTTLDEKLISKTGE